MVDKNVVYRCDVCKKYVTEVKTLQTTDFLGNPKRSKICFECVKTNNQAR